MIFMLHCRYHSENPMVRSAGILTLARVSEGSVLLLFYFLAYQKGYLLLLCNFFSSILVPLTGSEFRLRLLLGVLHKSPTWGFVFILQFVLEILLGGIELVNRVFQQSIGLLWCPDFLSFFDLYTFDCHLCMCPTVTFDFTTAIYVRTLVIYDIYVISMYD